MNTLESRVEKLERQNRVLKCAGMLALAAVSCLLLMGQSPGDKVWDELRTRRLTVVDEAGKERARLSMVGVPDLDYREPALLLFSESAKVKVDLRIAGDESIVPLMPMLRMLDEDGLLRVMLETGAGGSSLRLSGPSKGCGKVNIYAGLDLQGGVGAQAQGVQLWSDWKTKQVERVSESGAPRLRMEDPEGYAMSLGVTELLTPSPGTTTRRSAASIVMFDREKNVTWEAPR